MTKVIPIKYHGKTYQFVARFSRNKKLCDQLMHDFVSAVVAGKKPIAKSCNQRN